VNLGALLLPGPGSRARAGRTFSVSVFVRSFFLSFFLARPETRNPKPETRKKGPAHHRSSFRHTGRSLASLSVSYGEHLTDASIKAIAAGCPSLASLRVYDCRALTEDSVKAIVDGCPALACVRAFDFDDDDVKWAEDDKDDDTDDSGASEPSSSANKSRGPACFAYWPKLEL